MMRLVRSVMSGLFWDEHLARESLSYCRLIIFLSSCLGTVVLLSNELFDGLVHHLRNTLLPPKEKVTKPHTH
jgi:hypothetical protein